MVLGKTDGLREMLGLNDGLSVGSTDFDVTKLGSDDG